MRGPTGGVILLCLVAGIAAADGPASAAFGYEGSSSYSGSFSGRCTSVGIISEGGALELPLSTEGGDLVVRRTQVNHTATAALVVPEEAELREQSFPIPPGPVLVSIPADGLLVGFGFRHGREFGQTFTVDWNASSASFSIPVGASQTPARFVWMNVGGQAQLVPSAFPGWTRHATINGTATGQGDLTLYARAARIEFGASELELGPYVQEKANTTTPLISRKMLQFTDAFIDLRGVQLALPPALKPVCTNLQAHLQGRWAAASATGTARGSDGEVHFQDRVVELEGSFDVNERPADLPLGTDVRGRVEAQAEGDIRLAALDFANVADSSQVPAAAVAVGLAGFLLAVAAWGARHTGVVVGAFYSRFGRDQALDNQNRDLVHEAIRANPATDLSDLAVLTGLHRTTVFYHVQVLERVGLVSTLRHGRSVRVLGRELRNGHDLPRILTSKEPRYAYLAEVLGAGPRPLREVAPLLAQRFGLGRRASYRAVDAALRHGVIRRVASDPEVMLACAPT